jgi:predicted TIM-barrel fold metal-dependent hydrolase
MPAAPMPDRERKMIIDIHSHVGDPWFAYWKQNVDVEDHLTSMNQWGIDIRCISWWQPHNAPDKGNRIIAETVRKYPDRFLGFAVINPRWHKLAVKEVFKAKEEYGMVGLKFHPAACHYRPDLPIMDAIVEKAIELRFPMLFHCGADEFSNPHNLIHLARRFPEATIIMAHMGEEAWFEAIALAGSVENVILDTTGSQNWYRILNYAIEMVGEDRIVFGMDFPAYNPGPEISKVRDADLTPAQKDKIMGENAARILALSAT